MEELDTRLPVLKIFGKLLETISKNDKDFWVVEVYLTDKELDTYKIVWETPAGIPITDGDCMRDIQVEFLLNKSNFEKVKENPYS
jgi:hypothetical protein